MRITRRSFLKMLLTSVTGSGVAVVGGYQYSTRIEAHWLSVEHIAIPLNHLKSALEGFKIVCMSDFHLHPYTQIDTVREAVTLANSLSPDLIVLTGDYVLESADSIFELAPELAQLNAKYGVFTILGNHDLWTNADVVQAGLEEAGLPVLKNEGLALQVGKEMLYLAGLDDGWSGQPDLDSAMAKHKHDVTTILLMHEPDFANTYSQDGRIALQLSGHSHGGQVRIPGIGALILPPYARQYDQGLYQVDTMWLYTTRGIGVIGPPVRFCCRPEVTEITLVRA